MKLYLRIIKYVLPYRLQLLGSFLCMLGFVFTSVFSLGLVMPILDLIFSKDGQIAYAQNPAGALMPDIKAWLFQALNQVTAAYSKMQILAGLCLILPIGLALKNLFGYGQQFFNVWIEQNIVRDLRTQLFSHLQKLPVAYFSKNRTGEIVSRIVNDTVLMLEAISSLLSSSVREPLFLISYLFLLFVIDWRLAVLSLIIIPFVGFIVSRMGNKIRKYVLRGQEKVAALTSFVMETITNIRVVKSYCAEAYEEKRIGREIEDFRRTVIRQSWIGCLSSPITEVLGSVMGALILWYGGRSILSGTSDLTPGSFFLFLGSLFSLVTPLKNLGTIYNTIRRGMAAAERVTQILDTKPSVPIQTAGRSIKAISHSIRFENVWFAYEGENWVLKDISLEIPRGATVAIVGSSGAGKSTFVDMLPRFYDPLRGRITIDGTDLRDLALTELRSMIAMVNQETLLFHDTVRNNIVYNLSNIPDERVLHSAVKAHAAEFVEQMPEKYHTVIGDRGIRLSGGQRQRLALARAFLRDAPILILDEATSALDTESERYVQDAIQTLMAGKTNIIIAHRLSTIKNADRIYVIDQGRIAQAGTHSELFSTDGIYQKLYHLYQFAQ